MALRGFLVAAAGMVLAALPAQAESMIGAWKGVGLQVHPDGWQETWDIRITIRADITSRIEYPSLGCKGELKEVSRKSDAIEFEEHIASGAGLCEDRGRLLVTLRDGRMSFFWWKPGTSMDASAVLHRDLATS
jgi:hypothetical protein